VSEGVNRFYGAIENAEKMDAKELIALFVYFLIVEAGGESASAGDVDACFVACDLTPPRRTAAHLSEGVGEGKYIKAQRGYKLQRHYRDVLSKMLGAERVVAQASVELRKLEEKFGAGSAKAFLQETIACFEAGANRATIVMCWILALDHLIEYTMAHHLPEFNKLLAANTDRRVKVTAIVSRDDFGDIPENKLIELFRSARVIDNDVRKILDQKLGTRNSYAHPSSLAISRTKVMEFVEDLVSNVVLKYKI
jgi:hypothetical protein